MAIPGDFQTDWRPVARAIVHDSLQTQPGERVLIQSDPTYFPELTEQVRIEVAQAGAFEVAAMEFISPALEAVRRRLRRREDPALKQKEDQIVRALFDLADIYIWLPTSWPYNLWQTEDILTSWQGRSVHFHWVMEDPLDPTICRMDASTFRALSEQYVRALFIDREALTARQRRLAEALRGQMLRITSPAGTDLSLRVGADAHFHYGNGDASAAFIAAHARPGSARDREVELPCGALRTVDVGGADGVLAVPEQDFGGRFVGTLRVTFRDGHIVSMSADHHPGWVRGLWEQETGDRDRVAEFAIGVNEALRPQAGRADIPYYGYGAGMLRVSLGDNTESGGTNRSSFQIWLFQRDATISAGGRTLVDGGQLVVA
jgi:leucyl aminopeptidase (aminopeptidase T)